MRKFDHSMLADCSKCPQYGCLRHKYGLRRPGLKNKEALSFGQCIHTAMDVRYSGGSLKESHDAFLAGMPKDEAGNPKDIDEKRSVHAGKAIITDYYLLYESQLIDDVIAIEDMYKVELKTPWGEIIEFWSKIDKMVRWVYGTTPVDHKTTSDTMDKYKDKVEDTWQYVGYIYTTEELFPDAHGLLVDAIHVPRALKSKDVKTQFDRFTVTANDWDFDDWRVWVFDTIENIDKYEKRGAWPKHKARCNDYFRSCQFKEICRLPMSMERKVEQALRSGDFVVEMWEPWKTKEEGE